MKSVAVLLIAAAVAASAGMQSPDRAEGWRTVAPTGEIRAAVNLANPNLVSAGPPQWRGVAIDLGRELAGRAGVAFRAIPYPNAGDIVADSESGKWDVAFLADDPARAPAVIFSPAYMEVDNLFLVAGGSRAESISDLDQPSTRIAVPDRSAPDLFLSRTLRRAELVRISSDQARAAEMLRSGEVSAVAADHQWLLLVASRVPRARVIEKRFLAVRHTIAVPKGRSAGAQVVGEFVKKAVESGMVAQAIARAGLVGVRAASAKGTRTGR